MPPSGGFSFGGRIVGASARRAGQHARPDCLCGIMRVICRLAKRFRRSDGKLRNALLAKQWRAVRNVRYDSSSST